MKKVYQIIYVLFLLSLTTAEASAQTKKDSPRGMLFPETYQPNLNVKVVSQEGKTNTLFAGAHTMLDLFVLNTGNLAAEQCWLRIDTDSPFVIPRITHVDLFSLEAGDSMLISVPIQVSEHMNKGSVRLTIDIEEAQGYHLHPSRTVNYFVEAKPEFDLVVIDVAARDQRGVGYFDKFEEVELFFRVQNCAGFTVHNVVAMIDVMDGTIPVSVNPRHELGNMEPGETRDVHARVSTGMVARHVGISLKLEAEETSYVQEFVLDFLTDYSSPEELKTDGCADFIPELSDELVDGFNFETLPPKPPLDNQYAIVISNYQYLAQPHLDYAHQDAKLFMQLLQNNLGYKPENIFVFADMWKTNMANLFSATGTEGQLINRALRRAGRDKVLTVFYVGHAAVDLIKGETYLLPVNFVVDDLSNLYSLSEFYHSLLQIKAQFDISAVTCFLNINNLFVTQTGKNTEKQMPYVDFHRRNPDFSSIISSPTGHATGLSEDGESSLFTRFLVGGLEGRADLNGNRSVSAKELHQFMTDEFFGIPARVWEQTQTFQVPLLLGEDRIIY